MGFLINHTILENSITRKGKSMKMYRKHGFLILCSILIIGGISQIAIGQSINEAKLQTNNAQVNITDSDVNVAATSGILADFVGTIIGQDLEPIIDAGTCPGHYDIQPEDAAIVASADVVFYHGFEGDWFITLVNENNPTAKLIKIEDHVSGPWLPPSQATKYLRAIAQELIKIFPEKNLAFSANLNTYIGQINENAAQIKQEFAQSSYYGASAVVMEFQAIFATWLGLKVVVTFGTDESLGAQDIQTIVTEATTKQCTIVIMNLPSGTDAGKEIANEIGAKYAIFGNFAGDLGTESYIDLLWKNMEAAKDPTTPGFDSIGINNFLPLISIIGISAFIIGRKLIRKKQMLN